MRAFLDVTDEGFADVCFTADVGRASFRHRLALVASDAAAAVGQLSAFLAGVASPGLYTGEVAATGHAKPVEGRGQAAAADGMDGERATAADEIAGRFVRGETIDWSSVWTGGAGRRVVLPTSPFERERYWVERDDSIRPATASVAGAKPASRAAGPLLGHRLRSALADVQFESVLDLTQPAFAWLADHQVFGEPILPATACIELGFEAGRAVLGNGPAAIEQLTIREPLRLAAGARTTVQIVTTPADAGALNFRIFSLPDGDDAAPWTLHASGTLTAAGAPIEPDATFGVETDAGAPALSVDEHYQAFATRGLVYGPRFRAICALGRTGDEVVARVQLPDGVDARGYRLHPVLLDACLQAAGAALAGNSDAYVPAGCDRISLLTGDVDSSPIREVSCRTRVRVEEGGAQAEHGSARLTIDADLLDAAGRPVAQVRGLHLQRVDARLLQQRRAWADWLYEVVWEPSVRFGRAAEAFGGVARDMGASAADADAELQPYCDTLERLEAAALGHVALALKRLGFGFEPGTRIATDALADEIGVIARHRRLFARLLQMLGEDGVLEACEAGWIVRRTPVFEVPVVPGTVAEAERRLLARCGARLHDVLRGACDPLELLFAGGDIETAAAIYGRSPGALAMNRLVQRVVREASARVPADRGLRVLEIGAGTGGTTEHLLPHLDPARTEYVFSDVSPSLVADARARFRDRPFVRARVVDVERDGDLDAAGGPFDLVIAANVLHATADLGATLDGIRRVMAPGGLLILLEGTKRQRMVDLTFGLTDGWWRFRDVERRPDHPLLDAASWQRLLVERGFEEPLALTPGEDVHQAVLVARNPVPAPKAERWMILAGDRPAPFDVGRQLAVRLREHGVEVTVGLQADAFAHLAPGEFAVPATDEGFARLLREVPPADVIVHAWSLSAALVDGDATAAALTSSSVEGCASLASLARALEGSGRRRVVLVTRGAVMTDGDDTAADREGAAGLAQAPLWGMGRTLALEYPELDVVRVDLDPAGTTQTDVRSLLDEVPGDAGGARDEDVAFRTGTRLAARLVRHAAPRSGAIQLSGTATYLITGGLGGLGLRVARLLVDRGARHLLLVGRRSTGQPPVAAMLRELERDGAEIVVAQADVSRRDAIAAVLAGIDPAHPLRGIVHAAGVLDDRLMAQLDRAGIEAVFAPKVAGGWHLHQLTRHARLDFFVLFSSTAALVGSAGQANHAAANTFLDALAGYRRRLGLPGLSIAWGPWGDVGAAVDHLDRLQARGIGSIAPAIGIEILEALMSASMSSRPALPAQLAVFPVDWHRYRASLLHGRVPSMLASMLMDVQPARGAAVPLSLLRQWQAAAPDARAALLDAYLRASIGAVLGVAGEDLADPVRSLGEFGFDSLMAMDLRNRLQTDLAVDVPMAVILESGTLDAVGRAVVERLQRMAAAPEVESEAAGVDDGDADRPASILGATADAHRGAATLQQIDRLGEADVDALLEALLAEQDGTGS